jgi:Cu/Ag efflux protein CusF
MAVLFMSGVVFAPAASAKGTASTSQQQGGSTGGTGQDQEKKITGTVQNVNIDQKQITVTGPKGNSVQYTLNDNTMLQTQAGETIRVGDLKPGSKVTIYYTGTGANAKVSRVDVQRGK